MKKLGKIKILTIASLSALALAGTIALAQTGGTNQDNKQIPRGERHGHGEGWGGQTLQTWGPAHPRCPEDGRPGLTFAFIGPEGSAAAGRTSA